jgi:hypothetical protein
MASWQAFEDAAPAIAAAGRQLIYQYKVGLGYLATVRKDGGPRVHPVCPVIAGGRLWVFVGNHSPKRWDLLRDGRYALHAFPVEGSDDEFYLAGTAQPNQHAADRSVAYEALVATGAHTSDDTLFELDIERALHAKYEHLGAWPPAYAIWRDRG